MYVLSQTSLRCRIPSASSAVTPSGIASSRLEGDQKRFQIDAAGREYEGVLIALELAREPFGGLNRSAVSVCRTFDAQVSYRPLVTEEEVASYSQARSLHVDHPRMRSEPSPICHHDMFGFHRRA